MDQAACEGSHTSGRNQSSSRQSSRQSSLCEACLSVLETKDLELEEYYQHHDSLDSFIEATHERCYICCWVLSLLSTGEQENLKRLAKGEPPNQMSFRDGQSANDDNSASADVHRRKFPEYLREQWLHRACWDPPLYSFTGMVLTNLASHTLQVSVHLNPWYEKYIPHQMEAYSDILVDMWKSVSSRVFYQFGDPVIITHKDFTAMGLPKSLPDYIGSEETWKTVKRWIKECSNQHQCLRQVDPNWYPTRLVERLSDDKFRVIRSDSSFFKPNQGYITLSHRWGDKHFLRLTAERLQEFQNGLPIRQLRKVFQDALIVCKELEIPYLWIDSLCIIQSGDNDVDWRRESVRMPDIYSNSRCNISADWGEDGDHVSTGLFFTRKPAFEEPYSLRMQLKIPATGNGGLTQPEMLSPPADGVSVYIVRRDGWCEDVTDAPLNKRGWVLQERMLAPCVLHFSPQQLSWECRQNLTWERVPLNFNDSGPWSSDSEDYDFEIDDLALQIDDFDQDRGVRRSMERLQLNAGKFAVNWRDLLMFYSGCHLKFPSDKLVAIAGIAKRLRPIVKDQYVAGLWAKSLPEALLWVGQHVRKELAENDTPPSPCHVPTFSWAAADRLGSFPFGQRFSAPRLIKSIDFIKYREQPWHGSSTDEILTADIFVPTRTPTVELRLRGILKLCHWAKRGDSPTVVGHRVKGPETQHDFENRIEINVELDRLSEEVTKMDHAVYCYAILGCFHIPGASSYARLAGSPPSPHRWARGLLLRLVDASMGRFERVGSLTYHYGEGGPGIDQRLDNEKDLPAVDYNRDTGEHTFYIV